jgi:hypothetical protein
MIGSQMGLQEVAVVETHEMLFRRLPEALDRNDCEENAAEDTKQNYFAALRTREGLDSFEQFVS